MSPTHDDIHLLPLQVPIIDLSLLHQSTPHPHTKSVFISQIHQACLKLGCFQIVNHGISESVIEGALDVNSKFFETPMVDKVELMSDDIYKPARFSTIWGNHPIESEVLRHFLKLHAHPLEDFVALWPRNPHNYREKMGMYTKEVRKLGLDIIGAIMESLNVETTYLRHNLEQGMQMMAINSYPPSPPSSQSDVKIGALPHTDHSIITILLQGCSGLHVMDTTDSGAWKVVPSLKGSLVVLVGDQLEVISNGLYKSVLHRAVPSADEARLSIASFQSLGMDEVVEPAPELVDEEHPRGYKGNSLQDFLKHLSSKEAKPFIETLRI